MKLVGKLPDHLTHRKLIICLRPHRLRSDTSPRNSNPPVADSTFLFSPAGLRVVDLERSEALAADLSVCAHQDGLVPACSHIMGNDVLVHLPSLPAPNVSQRAERGLFLLGQRMPRSLDCDFIVGQMTGKSNLDRLVTTCYPSSTDLSRYDLLPKMAQVDPKKADQNGRVRTT